MENLQKIRDAQRSVGPACILGIGKAHPPHYIYQKDYPDYYFRVTNSEDKVELKEKFKRICKYIFFYTPYSLVAKKYICCFF